MKPLAPSLPVGVAAALSLALAASPASAQDAQVRDLDIPAQEASAALVELCLVADCELVFIGPRPEQRTQAVRGRMSWRTAVRRMLGGAGLRHRFVGARGVRVWAETRTRPAARSPMPETTPTELEPVVVLGRLSDQIDESVRRKREADVISDGVSAARIGELPAANLAEALQRVPGVAIEREVGEGQFVSVRGLGPLFQSVTLNGAPVAFNENIRNSTQSGRQFRFRALSADLLAGARLTKSSTPDLIDGGIGANIDIETVGGLDDAPFLTLRAGAGLEQRTGRISPDLSLAGRLISADGDRGVVAGVAQEERSVMYDRFQIQRYRDVVVDGQTVAVPNDVRTTLEREDRRRRSAFLGTDWRLAPGLSLDLDALVSTFDNAIREDRLVFGLGEQLPAAGSAMTVSDGVATGGQVTDGEIDNNTEFSDQSHLNLAVSAGAVWRPGRWRITPRLSASLARSVLDRPLQRISASSPDGVAYAFDLGDAADSRRAASLSTAFDLLDPSLLGLPRLHVRAVESRDDDITARVDARRLLDGNRGLSAVQFGVQFSDRSRDYQRRDREALLRPGRAMDVAAYALTTPDDVFADLLSTPPGPWIAADPRWFDAAFDIPGAFDGISPRPRDLTPTGADLQNSYGVGERVAAAYVRLDIARALAGRPVFGNFGVRRVETWTEVDGSILGVDPAGAVEVRPETYSGSHRVWLPSANVAIELDEDRLLRLAVSRSITRPSLADLRSATVPASTLVRSIFDHGQAAIDDPEPGTIFTGVGGNPTLRPYLSTNYDLSWEWSFPRGALSVALFHKSIDDFILTVEAPEQLVFETRDGGPVAARVMMSRPRNVGEARTTGLELGFNHRLPSGLGLWASATLTDAGATDRTTGERRDLAGVSDVAWSLNPYFERGRLGLNLSWSWRSAFVSEADMQGGGIASFVVAPAGYLDAQATWEVGPSAQLVLAATNLTDTTDLAWEGDRSRLLQLGRAGRGFSLGLRWSL
ncbi:MAG: TonB-dependent receptor [Alphaproteobacteria bacterium]|nr:TonB-dependent receptor [Alphaproteobacteria bacterium]MBU2271200.1 TonB-dependent receptor [Alphaproteobacteria bacterium]MBU2417535.1 TonB-dependent receptor [Alphaproteobacteria bacterium]